MKKKKVGGKWNEWALGFGLVAFMGVWSSLGAEVVRFQNTHYVPQTTGGFFIFYFAKT